MQRLTYLLISIILLVTSEVHAEQYLTAGLGAFGFDDSGFNAHDKGSAEFMGQWRGNAFFDNFVPVAGVLANTDGGVLGYAGFAYDWQFAPKWYITPGLNVGLWSQGESIDLGGPVEFHETLGLGYAFMDNYRAGIEVSHTSNAHIYDTNPGVNSIVATISMSFGN